MAFSGALTLTDLNDFITPSQACIKPVEQTNLEPQIDVGAASTEIRIDSAGTYYEVSTNGLSKAKSNGADRKLEQAQINLNDCLACSGCITSAESVLITLQSHIEVLNVLEANIKVDPLCSSYKVPVISIAPQSLASLAAYISTPSTPRITPRQVLRRIRTFCRNVLGCSHVFDTTYARHLALQEHIREFLERKKHNGTEAQLPMLASACPGWICYAEKTHAEMLPFISRTKSPQQIMGTLVKSWMGTKWKKSPNEIYHVTVMPCYDKKLEASRQDFYNDVYSTRDVDCVITTGELELMMREKGWDLTQPVAGELDDAHFGLPEVSYLPELITHPGSSSGSYLHAILDYIRQTSGEPLTLSVQTVRNADYEEYILSKESNGEVVFKGAKCYGFRNLQNVVRKIGKETGVRTGTGAAGRLATARRGTALRRGAKEGNANSRGQVARYDYVEVMACPGGCVNGGGQLKSRYTPHVANGIDKDAEGYPRDWAESGAVVNGTTDNDPTSGGLATKWGDKEWTRQVEETYWLDTDTISSSRPSGLDPSVPNNPLDRDRLSSSNFKLGKKLRASKYQKANLLTHCILLDLCYRTSDHARDAADKLPARADILLKEADDGSCSSEGRSETGAAGEACDAVNTNDFDWTIPTPTDDGLDGDTIGGMMANLIEWHGDEEAEGRRKRLFRTQYRAVESEVMGLAVKW